MAHLNLVMIHPFRDGNGRLARALQTLVLARRGLAEPTFSSIEEWLGANTPDYYRVLAHTGAGAWHPERDAGLWVSFNLRAHHMQAQTLRGRIRQAVAMWSAIDEVITTHGLPERTGLALYEAALGYRIRRATYLKRAEVEERTASRDLKALVEFGLLAAVGETRARHYVAGTALATSSRPARTPRPPSSIPTRGCSHASPNPRRACCPSELVRRHPPAAVKAATRMAGEKGSRRSPNDLLLDVGLVDHVDVARDVGC